MFLVSGSSALCVACGSPRGVRTTAGLGGVSVECAGEEPTSTSVSRDLSRQIARCAASEVSCASCRTFHL